MGRIYSWGQKWNINFEPDNGYLLCVSPRVFLVSLIKDGDLYPP